VEALTNSEMAAWTMCPRGWWIQYYRRLTPIGKPPSAMEVGSMYHLGLDAYYTKGEVDPAGLIVRLVEQKIAEYPDFADRIRKDGETASIMLEGYVDHCEETGWDAEFKILGAEQTVEVGLGETGFRLRGKIDTRVERVADGAWLQFEHKTVGNLSDIPKYAQSAPQFLTYDLITYLLALREEGRRTDGVLINMARRVKRTSTAKPPFYGRHTVLHNADELRSHFMHIVAIAREIEQARLKLDAGWSVHDVCYPVVGRDHVWKCRCAPIGNLLDDGSDVEEFLEEFYEPHDPWARYKEEEGGT
jgi:hypothetical protein